MDDEEDELCVPEDPEEWLTEPEEWLVDPEDQDRDSYCCGVEDLYCWGLTGARYV